MFRRASHFIEDEVFIQLLKRDIVSQIKLLLSKQLFLKHCVCNIVSCQRECQFGDCAGPSQVQFRNKKLKKLIKTIQMFIESRRYFGKKSLIYGLYSICTQLRQPGCLLYVCMYIHTVIYVHTVCTRTQLWWLLLATVCILEPLYCSPAFRFSLKC